MEGICSTGDTVVTCRNLLSASFSLMRSHETAKANDLEPSAYIHYVLGRIAEADTLEKLEALLPWNAELPALKKVAQYG